MRIINRTSFDTRSLRSVFCAALREDERLEGPLPAWQRTGLRIVVVSTRWRRGCSGYAFYNGTLMRLRLPDAPSMEDVVWLFLHELAHVRGDHHQQMSDVVLRKVAVDFVAAHPELALRPKPVPEPKTKPPLRIVRYEHAKAMLAAKERDAAKIKRQAEKWRRKVRYYERALQTAAATQQPVDPPEDRRSDPICGEDTCAACEQTTCRPNDDCDEAFTASAAALLRASRTDCDDCDQVGHFGECAHPKATSQTRCPKIENEEEDP